MMSVKAKYVIICIFAALFFSSCNDKASEISMPIIMENVENVVSAYDTDIIVLEEDAWRDGQKVYSLTDKKNHTVAYLSSVGEQNEGTLNLILMRNEQSESNLYQNNYSTVIKLAMNLFDNTLDSSQVYNDFINDYESNEEKDFDWRNTYNNTTINIKLDVKSPVEMSITLYNSEKYNPFPREANADHYSIVDPDVQVYEITNEQFNELLCLENNENDNFTTDSQNYRFYKIIVSDYNYHAKFKVDLSLFIKINLLESSENLEYEGILHNFLSDEYAFQDVVGYCQRNENEIVAVLNIPIVEIIEKNEVQYKEKFNYKILFKFSIGDLDNIKVSALE